VLGGIGAAVVIGQYDDTQTHAIEAALWAVDERRPLSGSRVDVARSLGVLGVLLPLPYFHSNEAEACAELREWVRRAVALASDGQ
jgi:hypothetical protein